MNAIGDRLKHIRETAGLKQKDMANLLGIKLPGYNRIEKGFIDITLKHLIAIQQRFNISLDWLITGKEPEPPEKPEPVLNTESTEPSSFGEFSGTVRQMLKDMEKDQAVLHGMLSQYHEIKLRRASKGNGNDKELKHEN